MLRDQSLAGMQTNGKFWPRDRTLPHSTRHPLPSHPPVSHPNMRSVEHETKDKGGSSLYQHKKLPSYSKKAALRQTRWSLQTGCVPLKTHGLYMLFTEVLAGRDLPLIHLPYDTPSTQFISGGCRFLLLAVNYFVVAERHLEGASLTDTQKGTADPTLSWCRFTTAAAGF